ncbi:MAG: CDP-alcohol phosphatidyltransferase family protein [Chloroflexi bacterium]|nr:CDP-alcohol phosphatidyltransferase family protein [Chloroflexota bacterium]
MFSDIARKWSRQLLRPIARFFWRLGVTPNALTIGGFLLVAGVSVVLARGYFRIGGILLLLTVWLDAVDGALARETGQVTRLGSFLDSTLDRYAEGLLYFGLLVYYTQHRAEYMIYLIYLTILGSLLVSYTRAKAESIGVQVTEGLLTRFERLVILILGLIFLHIEAALWILAPLTHITAIQRILIVWKRAT